jgi:hypothetical protein
MESGSSLMPVEFKVPGRQPYPRVIAAQLGQLLGCGGQDNMYLVACLKTKDAQAIVNATQQIYVRSKSFYKYTVFGKVHQSMKSWRLLTLCTCSPIPYIIV